MQIGKACKFVGQNAIQLHGGMGMTDEMAIGHYFKRATMIESAVRLRRPPPRRVARMGGIIGAK